VADPAAAAAKIKAVRGIKNCFHQPLGEWTRFSMKIEGDPRESLHALAGTENWPVRELSRKAATLEQVFVEVTTTAED
jgi:hypothetical protein